MGPKRWGALLIGLGACQDELRLDSVPLPEDRTGSALLVRIADRAQSVYALPLPKAGGPGAAFEFEPADAHYSLMFQSCGLSVLGLSAGAQTLEAGGSAQLPPASALFAAEVRDELVHPWSAVSALDAEATLALAGLPVPPNSYCRLLLPEPIRGSASVEVPGLDTVGVDALAGDGEDLLAALELIDDAGTILDAAIYRIHPDASLERFYTVDAVRKIRARGDHIWVLSGRGLLRIDRAGEARTVLPGPRLGPAGFDVSELNEPLELYALLVEDDRFRIMRVGETETATLAERRGLDPRGGAVVRLGPGRALVFVQGLPTVVFRIEGDLVSEEPFPARSPVTFAALLPGWGPLVGTQEGFVAQLGAAGWTTLGQVGNAKIRTIAPLGAGLAVLGCRNSNCDGSLYLYHPAVGFCREEPVGIRKVSGATSYGEHKMAALVGTLTGSELQLSTFDLGGSPHACTEITAPRPP